MADPVGMVSTSLDVVKLSDVAPLGATAYSFVPSVPLYVAPDCPVFVTAVPEDGHVIYSTLQLVTIAPSTSARATVGVDDAVVHAGTVVSVHANAVIPTQHVLYAVAFGTMVCVQETLVVIYGTPNARNLFHARHDNPSNVRGCVFLHIVGFTLLMPHSPVVWKGHGPMLWRTIT